MSDSARPPATPSRTARLRPWFWIVPALTFVVGLLLGGTLMATTGDPAGDDAPAVRGPATAVAPSPTASSGDRTIIVPATCEEGLQRARAALSTAGDAVEAARNLNTARLQELLDQLQAAQTEVEQLADQCRTQVRERN